MAQTKMNRLLLGVIVLGYWLVAGLFAVRTPDWQAPDEPAHYNYVAQIAEQGRIPVIEAGDWDSDYLEQLKSARFEESLLDDLGTVQYEDHQPPLYYVLLAPIYSLFDGSLTALRLFSVLIGTVIVVSAYGVAMVMYPERAWLGLATAGFVAFLPQHVAIVASVNNDALGWAVVGVILWATVHYLKHDRVKVWQLGLLVGIGLITKATTYFMVGVVPLAILLKWQNPTPSPSPKYQGGELATALKWLQNPTPSPSPKYQGGGQTHPYQQLMVLWLQFFVPALILGLLWWGRNFDVYGFPDFMGLGAHDAVVIGQQRTADTINAIGFDAYLRMGIRTTFNSFWGQFGWMAVPLEPRWYRVIQGVLVLIGMGLVVGWAQSRGKGDAKPEQRNAWIILLLTMILSILAYLYYNSEFQQFQGRYMFTLLIPLGIIFALGLDGWRRLIFTRLPLPDTIQHLSPYVILMPYIALAVWDVWLLWRVVVPNL